ncbi:TIGR00266 family protein [Pseudoxanthomonas kalamensis DSM 18571]|uniref:TIGR00266 family protein n=1 Tax=Pseudoxanthomonas kalamensis TaxID=289483 RepID=UPI0013916FB8|nr:TIGR00266 family protein [Pseudoxanthomonas kalamensis]KAF1712313.1 TIGR00266 family protein [Pseudoxanthomonas kalamensis DSM 18571]
MSQWHFHDPASNQRLGPMDDDAARALAASKPGLLCWREGMGDWKAARAVPELGVPQAAPPPPPPAGGRGRADEIDYRIVGSDMQFVEVELDPGESAIAEAGALMYKDAAVQMDTLFGDGSHSGNGGFMDKLLSAGKRVVTGESLFTTVFTHGGQGKAKVAFAAPYPGTVLAMKLDQHGGRLVCQKDSFLAGARGVSLGIFFQRKILTGLFGGEGFIMQKLEGDGWVFIHAGGTVVERELAAGERIDVDTGCVVAFQSSINMDVRPVSGIKSLLFGGEGMFLATLTGPGKIWLQSLPFSRLAGRMLQAAPQAGGASRGEGSMLGGLGRLLDGDNRF